MTNIKIEELVELKEKGMSDSKIAEYFISQGRKISVSNVNYRLNKYYRLKGETKPKTKTRKRQTRIKISDKELYELKQQGMSDREIAEHFTSQGRRISVVTVNVRLNKYYKLIGKTKPKKQKESGIEISDEELYKLKQQGMSVVAISEYFITQGKRISVSNVNYRLNKYYRLIYGIKPKNMGRPRIGISDEELYELKEKGMSDSKIAEYFASQGIKISIPTVNVRLTKYYKIIGKEKPIIKKTSKKKLKEGKTIKQEPFVFELSQINEEDKNIIYMMLTGKTMAQCNFSDAQKEHIVNRLKKIEIIAKHIKRKGEEWIQDRNFVELLEYIRNPQILNSEIRYYIKIKGYLKDGKCQPGNLELIKKNVFDDNEDMMSYVLLKIQPIYIAEYDRRIWDVQQERYEKKIKTYFERLYMIENSSRQNKSKSNASNRKQGEER